MCIQSKIHCSINFVFKDFLNADPNCPGFVVTAFEMIEMLKNQGSKGILILISEFI